jgi:hypothetical protein
MTKSSTTICPTVSHPVLYLRSQKIEDVLSNQDKLNQRYTKIQNTSSGRFNRKLIYKEREGNIRGVKKNDIKQKVQVKKKFFFLSNLFCIYMMLYFIFERREKNNELLLIGTGNNQYLVSFLSFRKICTVDNSNI